MNESLTQAFAPWRGLELDSAAIEEALANAYNLGFYELMGRYKALACDYFLLTNEFFKWSRFSRGIEDSLCIVMTGFLITALSKCGIKAAPHEFDRPHDLPTPRIPDHFVTLIQWRIIADLTFGQYDPNWAGRFLVDDDIARYEKRLMEAMRAANQRWSSDPTQTSEQLRRAFNTARAA
jgi:hypothetical protein